MLRVMNTLQIGLLQLPPGPGFRGAWTDSWDSGRQIWQLQIPSPWLNYTLYRYSCPPGVSLDFRSGSQHARLICCWWSFCNSISKHHYLVHAARIYWCRICYLFNCANNTRCNRTYYFRDVSGIIYFRSTKS